MACRIKKLTQDETVLCLKFIQSMEFDYKWQWSQKEGNYLELNNALASLEEYLKFRKDEFIRKEKTEQRGGTFYGYFDEHDRPWC